MDIKDIKEQLSIQDVENLMGNLVYQFNECVKDVECNTLIAIFVFIFIPDLKPHIIL